MRLTFPLFQYTARLTLFTRSDCSLCETAKSVLGGLGKKRSSEYHEIDVMVADHKQWEGVYKFDMSVMRNFELASCPSTNAPLYSGPRLAGIPYLLKAWHCYGSSEAYASVYQRWGGASDWRSRRSCTVYSFAESSITVSLSRVAAKATNLSTKRIIIYRMARSFLPLQTQLPSSCSA